MSDPSRRPEVCEDRDCTNPAVASVIIPTERSFIVSIAPDDWKQRLEERLPERFDAEFWFCAFHHALVGEPPYELERAKPRNATATTATVVKIP